MGWSGFAKFFGVTAKVKLEDGMKAATAALARMDPEAASQAQVEMMDDKLSVLREKLVKAQRAVEQDLRETADWEKKAEDIRQGLRILKGRLETAASETDKANIMDKARALAGQLEKAMKEVEREKGEDAEKKAILDQVQGVYDQILERRNTIESQLGQAKQRMESAAMREEMAKMREQEQKELAGLAGGFDEIGIALDAMNRAADDSETKAKMAELATKETASRTQSGAEDLLKDILGEESRKASSGRDPFAGI